VGVSLGVGVGVSSSAATLIGEVSATAMTRTLTRNAKTVLRGMFRNIGQDLHDSKD
jgi:hypothetical protein